MAYAPRDLNALLEQAKTVLPEATDFAYRGGDAIACQLSGSRPVVYVGLRDLRQRIALARSAAGQVVARSA